jgi:ADP-ribose pyrophosphatase
MARGLDFGETDFDDDEYIEIEKIPVDELVRMICSGEITDAKTQAGVLKAAILINAEKGKQ